MIPDEVIIRAGTNMLAHTDMVPLEYVRQLEKDAERYRWLRESGKLCASRYGVIGLSAGAWQWSEQDKQELDASIDNALRGE